MDKENVRYNGILFSGRKEWNLATCDNTDGPRGHILLSGVRERKTNAMWFHLRVESKEQSEQNGNRLIDTENKLVTATRGAGLGTLGEKGEGLTSANCWLRNSLGDVCEVQCGEQSINSMVVTTYGARWGPDWRDHCSKYINVSPLCCTLETSIK